MKRVTVRSHNRPYNLCCTATQTMRYFPKCGANICDRWFRAWEPRKSAHMISDAAHEAFIATFVALFRLRRGAAPAAQCGARTDLDLPAYAVAAGRLQLPSSADLFGLRRRGDRAFRAVGRRMDDVGAAIALPALGYFGNRQRAADDTAGRPMVSTVAVRAMAQRQRALR